MSGGTKHVEQQLQKMGPETAGGNRTTGKGTAAAANRGKCYQMGDHYTTPTYLQSALPREVPLPASREGTLEAAAGGQGGDPPRTPRTRLVLRSPSPELTPGNEKPAKAPDGDDM